ncbi:unnamed protein product [Rotaria sordida]|nr:unnamed protein product [Rotaria sordida]CAF4079039.1 unnamed protein product [Rotaria sordida]
MLNVVVQKKGDPVEVVRHNKPSLEMFHQTIDQAQSGYQLGILLKNIQKEDIWEKYVRFTLREAGNKTVGTDVVTNLHPDSPPEELKKFSNRAA